MRYRVLPNVILAVVALTSSVAITVGWNVIFATYYSNAFTATDRLASKIGYWTIMAVGDLFLATVMTVIAIFLATTIRRNRRLYLQDAFIDRITHELRTPIAALRLAVDTCTKRDLDIPTMRQQLTDMRGDLDRLQDLVDHVIDAGRIEHGEWRPQRESIDLVTIAESCIQRSVAKYQVPRESVTLIVDLELSHLVSDRVAIEHILINLIDNAIKYSDNLPNVEVRLSSTVGAVCIMVGDRGIGIPPNEIAKIYRRFYRVASDRNRQGTGLGLYVIAQLCQQLGGRIVTAGRPGGGTLFTVYLPDGERGE